MLIHRRSKTFHSLYWAPNMRIMPFLHDASNPTYLYSSFTAHILALPFPQSPSLSPLPLSSHFLTPPRPVHPPHTPSPLLNTPSPVPSPETIRYSTVASRHTHTTSASYLDLLRVYQSTIGGQREQATVLLRQYKAGLAKLMDCEELLEKLEELEVSQLPSL